MTWNTWFIYKIRSIILSPALTIDRFAQTCSNNKTDEECYGQKWDEVKGQVEEWREHKPFYSFTFLWIINKRKRKGYICLLSFKCMHMLFCVSLYVFFFLKRKGHGIGSCWKLNEITQFHLWLTKLQKLICSTTEHCISLSHLLSNHIRKELNAKAFAQ